MLKVEPGSMRKTIVFQSNDPSIDSIHDVISRQLRSGLKIEAVETATQFIDSALGIPPSIASLARQSLDELQSRRLDNDR